MAFTMRELLTTFFDSLHEIFEGGKDFKIERYAENLLTISRAR